MIDPLANPQSDFAASAFFAKTYRETLGLAREACDYLEGPVEAGRDGLDSDAKLRLTAETLRLSTRIIQMMAWMYAQRAVQRGELTSDQARSAHRLGPRETCLPRNAQTDGQLPSTLQELMHRSEQLYLRVARLDDMLARDVD